jgi:hypothetical protein
MSSRQAAYRQYLRSTAWQTRRNRRVRLAGGQCEYRPPTIWYKNDYIRGPRCAVTGRLQVHHRHYETLGREADDDLMVLCCRHHLVLTVLDASCEFCGNELINTEEDACYLVDHVYEMIDPAPAEMSLDDVLASLTWLRDTGMLVCDSCDYMLSKDD